jgi:hypothetical protein
MVSSKVADTLNAAKKALADIIAEDGRVSVSAIEKRAGLSNGTLNYKNEAYIEFKNKVSSFSNNKVIERDLTKVELNKQKELKSKYKKQRDIYKLQVKKEIQKRLELSYQLFHLQQEIDSGKNKNIIEFPENDL